jgi:anti-sigma factor RsiW
MVSCSVVRELLTEHALGVTGPRESLIVERHLAWCAACRKEAQDLSRATAALAFAAPPANPPADLEDQVVEAVHKISGHKISGHKISGHKISGHTISGRPASRGPRGPRRSRRVGTLVLAAAIAVSGLGLGAVIAQRSAPEDQTDAAAERAKDALSEFTQLFEESRLIDPEADVLLGVLGPEGAGRARGTAMTIVVPRLEDRAVVMVTGLPDRAARLPYRVAIADGKGNIVEVGIVSELDPGGEATVITSVSRDLTSFVNVFVTDVHDRVVLRGTLRERTSVPSPAP